MDWRETIRHMLVQMEKRANGLPSMSASSRKQKVNRAADTSLPVRRTRWRTDEMERRRPGAKRAGTTSTNADDHFPREIAAHCPGMAARVAGTAARLRAMGCARLSRRAHWDQAKPNLCQL